LGLQNRVPRFNSGRGLQPSLAQRVKVARRSPTGEGGASRRELRLAGQA